MVRGSFGLLLVCLLVACWFPLLVCLDSKKTGKLPKKLGRYLSNLKDDRESGDYEVFSSIDRESAELSIKEASEFIEEIERYLQNVLAK